MDRMRDWALYGPMFLIAGGWALTGHDPMWAVVVRTAIYTVAGLGLMGVLDWRRAIR